MTDELHKALGNAAGLDVPAVTRDANLERTWLPNNANAKK